MTTEPTSFRFSEEEMRMLEMLSEKLGVSKAGIVRLLIRLGVKLLDDDIIEVLKKEIQS